MTTYVPYTGKCGRGLSKTRWSDEITKQFGRSWMRAAKDRLNWKSLVNARAQKWTVKGRNLKNV